MMAKQVSGRQMVEEEPKQWDLTKEEVKKLKALQAQQVAADRLLKMLLESMAKTADGENAWWNAVINNHKIPDEFLGKLISSENLGKVWLKGEVPELDNKVKFTHRVL
jgi:hypothetical protein